MRYVVIYGAGAHSTSVIREEIIDAEDDRDAARVARQHRNYVNEYILDVERLPDDTDSDIVTQWDHP